MAKSKKNKGLRIARPVSPKERKWRMLHEECRADAASRLGVTLRHLYNRRPSLDEMGEDLSGTCDDLLKQIDNGDLQGETLQLAGALCIELLTGGLIARRLRKEAESGPNERQVSAGAVIEEHERFTGFNDAKQRSLSNAVAQARELGITSECGIPEEAQKTSDAIQSEPADDQGAARDSEEGPRTAG